MLTRIRPDAVRWLLLAVNLMLTALLAWCALYAFNFNKTVGVALKDKSWYRPIEGYMQLAPGDLNKYKIPERSAPQPVAGRPQSIALAFDPPAPPPPKEETGEEGKDVAAEEAAIEGGPLSDKWTLEQVLETEGKAQVYAVLSEKQPEAKPISSSRGVTSFTSAPRLTTSSYKRPTTTGAKGQGKQKLLRIYDADVNATPVEIGERSIFFVEVQENPRAILYVEAKGDGTNKSAFDPKAKKYMLKKSDEDEPLDPFTLEGRDPNEDPNAAPKARSPQAEPDSRGSISVDGKALEPKTTPPPPSSKVVASTPGKRPTVPTMGTPSSGGPTPPSAKDVRELKSALDDMKKNIPPEELKKLNEAMSGRKR